MNIPYVFRKCSKCGEWLVACSVNFHKKKSGKYGLNCYCKNCNIERSKQYREDNKGKILEYHKQYREDNKDKVREYHKQYNKQYYENNKDEVRKLHKQYREDNKDKEKERHKQYYEDNKGKILERQRQRYEENKDKVLEINKKWRATPQGRVARFNERVKRRLKEQNKGNGITKEQFLECMKFFGFRCAYSGQLLTKDTRSLDHIQALNKDGEHEIWNLVPRYKNYNFSKRDKEMLEWYKKQDFYSEERLQKIYEWQAYAFNKWHKEEIV